MTMRGLSHVADRLPAETVESDPSHEGNAHRLPTLPRFRLRTLFLLMAGMSVLFMVMQKVGVAGSVLIIWALLLTAAHVVANAWGERRRSQQSHAASVQSMAPHGPVPPDAHAKATRLGDQAGISKLMLAFSAIGATCGGVLGASVLGSRYWHQGGVFPVVLGAISAAIIGGFFGFMVSSFVQVTARAFSEAAADHKH